MLISVNVTGESNFRNIKNYIKIFSVLAADAAKSSEDPKKCADAILQTMINEGKLTDENFRVGATKVFFKAGKLIIGVQLK